MTEIVIEQKVFYSVLIEPKDSVVHINQLSDCITIEHEHLPQLISALQQLNENTK